MSDAEFGLLISPVVALVVIGFRAWLVWWVNSICRRAEEELHEAIDAVDPVARFKAQWAGPLTSSEDERSAPGGPDGP